MNLLQVMGAPHQVRGYCVINKQCCPLVNENPQAFSKAEEVEEGDSAVEGERTTVSATSPKAATVRGVQS